MSRSNAPWRFAALLLLGSPAAAQEILLDLGQEGAEAKPEVFHTPYAFYSATWELAVGYGVVATGQVQEQMALFSAASLSTNGTGEVIIGTAGAHLPGTERIYVDSFLQVGHYTELRAYAGLDETGERSGSNESTAGNFVQDEANQVWFESQFQWVLPIGPGELEPIQTYTLDRGIVVGEGTGGRVWNPLTSGRTYLGLQPFYRRQEYDLAESKGRLATNGLAFAAFYDNTDFPRNPTYGSFQGVRLWRDFGGLDSAGSWTVLEGQAAKYFDLGVTDWARQQVLAFGAWTATTPTWEDPVGGADGVRSSGQPPYYMGATLGGRNRLRAFPSNRFNDKAGIHYWAEYRMIPGWQPLPRIKELRRADIDWWQMAAFVELGRVAPTWQLDTLHDDMQWDVGLSLRLFAKKALVRIDFAVGPEDWAVILDISQPF